MGRKSTDESANLLQESSEAKNKVVEDKNFLTTEGLPLLDFSFLLCDLEMKLVYYRELLC